MERITVCPNKRFLITESGAPFFWLGDTAWELFHRLTRPEIETYLENRRLKGFNVIQVVALAEFDGLSVPNMEGHLPLIDLDPAQPNAAYFDIVDFTIKLAAEKGLYIALLPTWADKVSPIWAGGPAVLTPEKAYAYGCWLGARYKNEKNVLWVTGGDRPAITVEMDYRPNWRALAAGIDDGCGYRPLKTYHPSGGHSTSAWLQAEDWLDMHMIQSGHGAGRDTPVAWETVAYDYGLSPTRPTLDGEANYEDHPVSPWPVFDPANGYFRDHDVRKQSYRSVFAGGCGVTYGHHSIWQFAGEIHGFFNHADRSWQAALDRPGAQQIYHLKDLILARPYWTRIPAQEMLLSDPGQGARYVSATRDSEGSFALIYIPEAGQTIQVDLGLLNARLRASWFDPRTGQSTPIGEIHHHKSANFTCLSVGPDWVLVLEAIG